MFKLQQVSVILWINIPYFEFGEYRRNIHDYTITEKQFMIICSPKGL